MNELARVQERLRRQVVYPYAVATTVEALFAILLGGFLGALLQEVVQGDAIPGWLWWSGAASAAAYTFTFVARLRREQSPIDDTTDAFRAAHQLRNVENDLNRKMEIDGYIESSIQQLNTMTCALDPRHAPHVQNTSMSDGLSSILGDLKNSPWSIVGGKKREFTIGIYLESWQKQDNNGNIQNSNQDWECHLLVNSLELDPAVLEDIEKLEQSDDLCLDIWHTIQSAKNRRAYQQNDASHDGKEYVVIASPIPSICGTKEPQGILFLATVENSKIPEDLPDVLGIFNQILAHWISKRNSCTYCEAMFDECLRLQIEATMNGKSLKTEQAQASTARLPADTAASGRPSEAGKSESPSEEMNQPEDPGTAQKRAAPPDEAGTQGNLPPIV